MCVNSVVKTVATCATGPSEEEEEEVGWNRTEYITELKREPKRWNIPKADDIIPFQGRREECGGIIFTKNSPANNVQ